jgi:hypothetical protein
MRLLKTLLVIVGLVAAALFLLQNQAVLSHRLPVRLQLPLIELLPFPPDGPRIDVLLMLTFLFGGLVGWSWTAAQRVRRMIELHRLRRRLADAEARLTEARAGARSQAIVPTPPADSAPQAQ